MYGDVGVMRRRVGELREQASEVRARAQSLVAQAEGVPWTGRAAETMRERVRDRAARMRDAARLHDEAAQSLEKHLTEVAHLSEAIAAVEHRHRSQEADATGAVSAETPPPGHRDWLTFDAQER
jgi:hypothetical protein